MHSPFLAHCTEKASSFLLLPSTSIDHTIGKSQELQNRGSGGTLLVESQSLVVDLSEWFARQHATPVVLYTER